MKPEILQLIESANCWGNHPAAENDIEKLKSSFGGSLPEDYIELLRSTNGCSIIGNVTPFIVYSISEVLALYREHDLYRYIPKSVVFGGDGGGVIYCFDLRPEKNMKVFAIYEEDAGFCPNPYPNILYLGESLTEMVQDVLKNEKLT